MHDGKIFRELTPTERTRMSERLGYQIHLAKVVEKGLDKQRRFLTRLGICEEDRIYLIERGLLSAARYEFRAFEEFKQQSDQRNLAHTAARRMIACVRLAQRDLHSVGLNPEEAEEIMQYATDSGH